MKNNNLHKAEYVNESNISNAILVKNNDNCTEEIISLTMTNNNCRSKTTYLIIL